MSVTPPQGTCAETWEGLPGRATYHPHCYWALARPRHYHCPTQGCFWQLRKPEQKQQGLGI